MATPEATLLHYRRQQRLTAATIIAARSTWNRLDAGALDESYRTVVGPRLLALTASTQRAAAIDGASYVGRTLDELDIDVDPEGDVIANRFAGIASDGRPLDSLLYEPVIRTKSLIGAGTDPAEATRGGLSSLEQIISTQLADAARGAAGVAIAARPGVGYVRMLSPPSCGRCAVLAGKFYRFNKGFPRHPRCDCRHIPSTENAAGDLTTDTDAYFASLSRADQDRLFTKAGAEAIRDGSDIGQVVNARRKGALYQADGHLLTREGTTRRGSAGKRLQGTRRLMPETIYREARDREHAIELLRRHGYLS